ncbi:MAG: sodium:proton antiporter [Myxococcota bacterium]
MDLLDITSILLVLAAAFAWLNQRYLRFPSTIGLMAIALVFSLAIVVLGVFIPEVSIRAESLLNQVDFNETLMDGMLGVLLFAGALHVDIEDLAEQRVLIGALSTVGVVTSTFLVGTFVYGVLGALGFEMSYMMCLLFGALISPTDPIAVLGILKTLGASKELSTQIAGESLFNDGVGVVVFLAIFYIAGLDPNHAELTTSGVALLFVQEAIGGAAFGLAAGTLAYYMLRSIDAYSVEVLITIALVVGGYTLASTLHLSGPIAMVVAGLFIGNRGRMFAMSDHTRQHLDMFWELIDEILNAVLFVLIGLEVLILEFSGGLFFAGLIAIPLVLLARLLAVSLPLFTTQGAKALSTIQILTWAGLRGGISVALALSIPRTLGDETIVERDAILAMTYIVVVFSILVQGLTVGPLIRRLAPESITSSG